MRDKQAAIDEKEFLMNALRNRENDPEIESYHDILVILNRIIQIEEELNS